MISKIKIYTDINQYYDDDRTHVPELLRPLRSFNDQAQQVRQAKTYNTVLEYYSLEDDIQQADWCVLPYAWNYYYETHQLRKAVDFITHARRTGKPVITWVTHDFGARVPVKDVWVFGCAGNKSRSGPNRFGKPVFIPDPLNGLGFNEIQLRQKSAIPRIGFCGYAKISPLKALVFLLRTIANNTAGMLGLNGYEPQDLYPPVLLRQNILENLKQSPLVQTDFIQRSNYKAGVSTKEEEAKAHQVFFNNIMETDYTVCMRGGGNYSMRLYETLAMGRIPILVDTDCLLPYPWMPEWRTACVYIKASEIKDIAKKVRAFHDQLSPEDFIETQQRARRFWEDRLSISGFFAHFSEHFNVQKTGVKF